MEAPMRFSAATADAIPCRTMLCTFGHFLL
jgi:hypothetical protein